MKSLYLSIAALHLLAYPALSLAVEEPLPGQSATQEEILLPEEDTASEVYDIQGGYVHPFLSLTGEYTDNLFNVYTNEKSNFLTTITPGVWFALPRTKEVPITLISHNASAGGLQYQLDEFAYEEFNRHNAYILGALDFEYYSEDSDLNQTNGRLEGLYRYNMKNGLSLQIMDLYKRDNDMFDIGTVTRNTQRDYDSNLLGLTADWEVSERIRAKADYHNFNLDYDEEVDAWLNRQDNAFGLYGYLNYSEKSSFFINYDYVDVAYEDAFDIKDNEQHFIYLGWEYASTEKTDLMLKLGYQERDFVDNSPFEDLDEFAFEFQIEHDFTVKTKLVTILSRRMDETDTVYASGKTVVALWARFLHKFSDRLTGLADFSYENADYHQVIPEVREDDRYTVRPSLQYIFNDWFMAELAYTYDSRDSTQDIFEYDTNTYFLGLHFAL